VAIATADADATLAAKAALKAYATTIRRIDK